jgi:hypothetical protein
MEYTRKEKDDINAAWKLLGNLDRLLGYRDAFSASFKYERQHRGNIWSTKALLIEEVTKGFYYPDCQATNFARFSLGCMWFRLFGVEIYKSRKEPDHTDENENAMKAFFIAALKARLADRNHTRRMTGQLLNGYRTMSTS